MTEMTEAAEKARAILRYRALALEERPDGRFAVTQDGRPLALLDSRREGIASFCAMLELRLNRTEEAAP